MDTYKTSEVAKIIGIHPNTVRMYEEWGLIPEAKRKPNGYRVFTDFHIEQLRLARIAFQIEVLQNGLRKKIVETVKISAKGDFDKALCLAEEYRNQIQKEQSNAEEAILIISRQGIRSGTLFRSIESLLRTNGSPLGSVCQQVISRFWQSIPAYSCCRFLSRTRYKHNGQQLPLPVPLLPTA